MKTDSKRKQIAWVKRHIKNPKRLIEEILKKENLNMSTLYAFEAGKEEGKSEIIEEIEKWAKKHCSLTYEYLQILKKGQGKIKR